MFANRLHKNLSVWRGRRGATSVSCYRLYDADMPEYAFAIDRYAQLGERPPCICSAGICGTDTEIDPEAGAPAPRARRSRCCRACSGVPAERIHLRLRRRAERRGAVRASSAPMRNEPDADRCTVEEGGLKFLVNLEDYLDTGLFLDHRLDARAPARRGAPGRAS